MQLGVAPVSPGVSSIESIQTQRASLAIPPETNQEENVPSLDSRRALFWRRGRRAAQSAIFCAFRREASALAINVGWNRGSWSIQVGPAHH